MPGWLAAGLLLLAFSAHGAGFIPPKNLDPEQPSTPTLDKTYAQEAWVIYTYEIDTQGFVVNSQIRKSNGVLAVENQILEHVNSMQFRPATRDGNPVKVSVGPIVFTWILDRPRELTAEFDTLYQQAWAHFNQQDYAPAEMIAKRLAQFPGRSAFEEAKYRILAASLASRRQDDATELRHLQRILRFQRLADQNNFSRPYVEAAQYHLILERVLTLQLQMNRVKDAESTLEELAKRDDAAEVTQRASAALAESVGRLRASPDIEIQGELASLYPEGRGMWETGLTRQRFSISNVKGRIQSVHLVCETGGEKRLKYPSRDVWNAPADWNNCSIEVAGQSKTRFIVHQLTNPTPTLR